MKNLSLFICTLLIFSSCGSTSSNEQVTERPFKEIKADSTSKDTLQIKKNKVPNFPKDDEETEKMDEIVSQAKKQKI